MRFARTSCLKSKEKVIYRTLYLNSKRLTQWGNYSLGFGQTQA